MRLVWKQKFDQASLDRNVWTFERGNDPGGNPGWGNQEMQFYTDRNENCRIENSHLIIEARREPYDRFHFTSARIKTQSHMEFKYGTLEARVKLPNIGKGLWPAFWLLGAEGQWPKCGEVDILEAGLASAIGRGQGNRVVVAAAHWWDYSGNHNADHGGSHTHRSDLNADFHDYKMTWDREFIRVFIDNQKYFEMDIRNPRNGIEAFHKKYFILLNLAVGGSFPHIFGPSQIQAPFPARLEVDWIRLYQNDGDELYIDGKRV